MSKQETRSNDMAFPFQDNGSTVVPSLGLTKREHFAAMAMQTMATKDRGKYSQSDIEGKYHLDHPKWVAQAAVDYADALIKALNEKEG